MCSVRSGASAHDPHRVLAGIQPLAFVRDELFLDVGVCILRSAYSLGICRELGIPHLIATIAAQENGQFTGKPRGTPSFREGKVSRVEEWLESMGLWSGCFERSWFYSDSLNDLPLLSIVSDPVAVDPDSTLRAHAESQGWMILNLHG